jgi:hypothetical protein
MATPATTRPPSCSAPPPRAPNMPSILMTDLSHVQTPRSPSWARPIRRHALDVQPSLRRRSTAVAFITALILAVAAPAFADAPPPTNGGNGAGQSDQCTGNPADAGRLRPQVDQPAAMAPASPGRGPWPILALAVTPTCFPPSRPEATCHSAKHSATGLTKAELPRRPPVQEVG